MKAKQNLIQLIHVQT